LTVQPSGLLSEEVGRAAIDAAMTAAEAQPPEEGLETVAALRARLEALEALHVEKALRAGWSWRQIAEAMGLTKQAVHKKHARRLAEKLASEPAADRRKLLVTGQARRSVRLGREEAAALGAERLRPDHLLLGLVRGEGPAGEALAAAGVTLERARRAARTLPADPGDDAPRAPGEPLPIASDARAVLEGSLREAVRRGDGHLGVEHLLLALLRDEEGRAVALLTALAVEPAEVERLVDERGASPV
jgi:ATP-dependent Clp protease ATP-binding subunit ClpA